MRSSTDGFLALTDAMVFIVVILAACAVVACISIDDVCSDSEPAEMLDVLESTMVRLSDLTDGDDSLVRLTDLVALHSVSPQERVEGYIGELLQQWSRGRGCTLHAEFADTGGDVHEVSFGSPGVDAASVAERTVAVSTGGSVRLVLELFSGPELRGPVGEVEADGDDVG